MTNSQTTAEALRPVFPRKAIEKRARQIASAVMEPDALYGEQWRSVREPLAFEFPHVDQRSLARVAWKIVDETR
jgi:hypothetical protein